jgi:hypothetical protein
MQVDPGSAAHHAAKSGGVLRRVRGTHSNPENDLKNYLMISQKMPASATKARVNRIVRR